MKAIYKYRLPFMETSQVDMPRDARIIRVGGLDGALWLWAVVDTEAPLDTRTFKLFKTGGEMPDDIDTYIYLGWGAIFVQMELAMYVFEKPGPYVPATPLPPPFDWTQIQETPNASEE